MDIQRQAAMILAYGNPVAPHLCYAHRKLLRAFPDGERAAVLEKITSCEPACEFLVEERFPGNACTITEAANLPADKNGIIGHSVSEYCGSGQFVGDVISNS